MLQRSVLSSALSPGAVDAGGKSVGSCTSVLLSSSFVSVFHMRLHGVQSSGSSSSYDWDDQTRRLLSLHVTPHHVIFVSLFFGDFLKSCISSNSSPIA